LGYVALIALALSALVRLVTGINGKAVEGLLAGALRERLTGGILASLGTAFSLRVVNIVVTAFIAHTPIPLPDLGLHIADGLLASAWIAGGLLLWLRKELGYVVGLGLLLQACAAFPGLIILMLIQLALTGMTLDVHEQLHRLLAVDPELTLDSLWRWTDQKELALRRRRCTWCPSK
jgi:hypothetical protein